MDYDTSAMRPVVPTANPTRQGQNLKRVLSPQRSRQARHLWFLHIIFPLACELQPNIYGIFPISAHPNSMRPHARSRRTPLTSAVLKRRMLNQAGLTVNDGTRGFAFACALFVPRLAAAANLWRADKTTLRFPGAG